MITRYSIGQFIWRNAAVLLALAGLAACSVPTQSPPVVTGPTNGAATPPAASAQPTATGVPTARASALSTPLPTVVPFASVTPTHTADPLTYERVEIAEAGLSFEVPTSWQRLDGAWAWSADGAEWPCVEVRWRELPPPLEPEAAMLPSPASIRESTPTTLGWGEGRRVTIEIYGSQPVSDDIRAPIIAAETHVIIVVQRDGRRYAYDFAARARTVEELAGPQAILDQLLVSSQLVR